MKKSDLRSHLAEGPENADFAFCSPQEGVAAAAGRSLLSSVRSVLLTFLVFKTVCMCSIRGFRCWQKGSPWAATSKTLFHF